MSKTVDERVVSMQFDNRQFENNVKTSMSTLEKLKQSLNFKDSAKGLESINAAAKNTNLPGLSAGVETVRAKFSALQVMGVTTLANITNTAVNAGKKIVSALTIDPIKTGFSEYETKINSIQTIMSNTASKGTTMEDVTRVIDDLNTYADKTIYNFAEMTRNIGTFTAAGVGLEKSASAIKGIANLAAASGSDSQQASTAMYQLSQALAAGTVKLQDWNSVVNAGMGGEKFQEALKATAREHGVAVDDIIKKQGSFRESLQTGWITADILNETLNKFTVDGAKKYAKSMLESGKWTKKQADALIKEAQSMEDAATKVKTFTQLWDTLKEAAQSGWGQTWELIVGDFEEAKELFSEISDVLGGLINKSADSRNKVVKGWKDLGGRKAIIDALRNSFEGIMSIITPIKEAFREIFPPVTAKQLASFSKNLRDLTAKLILSDDQSKQLKSTFKGLFAVIDIGVTFVKSIVSGIAQLIGNFTGLGNGILKNSSAIGDWLSGIRDSVKETKIFGKAIDGIVKFLQNGIDKFKEFAGFVSEKIAMPGFEGFLKLMQGIWSIIQKVGSKISEIGSSIGNAISGAFRSGDINSALDLVNGGILTGILLGVKKFVGGLTDSFDNVGGFLDNVKEILDGVKGSLEAWQQQLKAGTLLKIAGAIALLAGSLVVLSLIDPERLMNALGAITVLFGDLMGSLAIFNKMDGTYKSAAKAATIMIGMSISILILASALKKVAELSWDEIGRGLTGLVVLTGLIVAAAKIMSSKEKIIVKGAGQMILMATALKIMASVLKDMSTLSWEGFGKGLSGVAGILLTFVGFQKLMSMIKPKNMIKSSTSLLIMGAAMEIFANVCSKFEKISWEGLGKSGIAMAGILDLSAGFALLAGLSSKMIKSSITLVIIGASMKIFADVCSKFEKISWEGLGKSGAAIGGILALASGFALLSGLSSGIMKSVISLTIMSAAMEIFADVCRKFSSMEWEALGKAGVAIAGLLALATGFALLAGLTNGILSSSVALLIMATALRIFVPVMTTLGDMSWESIGKGLLTIAGAFAVMGIAGAVLSPVIPAILGLAGVLVLIGIATLTVGAGLLAASAGLTALSTVTAAAATAIVASLTIIITGIINLIPAVAQKIGEAIIVLCNAIVQGIPAIGNAIRAIIVTVVKVLVECVPMIVEGALMLISSVLNSLSNHIQEIVGSIMKIIIGVINGIAANLPSLIQAVINLVSSFFQGIVDVLNKINVDSMLKAITGLGLLSVLMIALSALAGLAPSAMVGVLAIGALIAELALVLAAVGALAQIPGLQWLINEGGNLLQSIGTAIGKFIGGIVGGIAEGAMSTLPQVAANLSQFMTNLTPFINGAKMIDPSVVDNVKTLASVIMIITGASLLESIASFLTGESSITQFASELPRLGLGLKSFSDSVNGINPENVTAAANAAKALAEMADTIPNEGGMVAWFTGENSMSKFAGELPVLGNGLKAFSDSVNGINAENLTAAANAGKTLAEMCSVIPNEGGVAAWFAGENSISQFGDELPKLGFGLKGFSDSVAGINTESISIAVDAAKKITEMTGSIPNSGGVASWFAGENSISQFGEELPKLGSGLKGFSDSIVGLNVENVTSASGAAKALAEMTNSIPNSGGVVAWFTGDNSISDFADELPKLGRGIKGFSNSLDGINPTNVIAGANAAKTLAEMTKNAPGDPSKFINFGEKLSSFGDSLRSYFNKVSVISSESISASSRAVTGIINSIQNIDPSKISQAASAIDKLSNSLKNASDISSKSITGFSSSLKNIGDAGVDSLLKSFSNAEPKMQKAGETMINKVIAGAKSKSDIAKKAFQNVVSDCTKDISTDDFKDIGKYVVKGFANGISENTWRAEAKATAMAEAAKEAAKEELDEHSPSKEFYKIGDFAGLGFVNALGDYVTKSYNAGYKMAKSAKEGIGKSIAKVASIVDSDIDSQPTIRPVLDLSSVSDGVSAIDGMFDMRPSVGVMANLRSISASMNDRQNGNNVVVSAIDDLKKTLSNTPVGNTYNINGITYDDGSSISNAVEQLVRAARVERRV